MARDDDGCEQRAGEAGPLLDQREVHRDGYDAMIDDHEIDRRALRIGVSEASKRVGHRLAGCVQYVDLHADLSIAVFDQQPQPAPRRLQPVHFRVVHDGVEQVAKGLFEALRCSPDDSARGRQGAGAPRDGSDHARHLAARGRRRLADRVGLGRGRDVDHVEERVEAALAAAVAGRPGSRVDRGGAGRLGTGLRRRLPRGGRRADLLHERVGPRRTRKDAGELGARGVDRQLATRHVEHDSPGIHQRAKCGDLLDNLAGAHRLAIAPDEVDPERRVGPPERVAHLDGERRSELPHDAVERLGLDRDGIHRRRPPRRPVGGGDDLRDHDDAERTVLDRFLATVARLAVPERDAERRDAPGTILRHGAQK